MIHTRQYRWSDGAWTSDAPGGFSAAQLVLVFADPSCLAPGGPVGELSRAFPEATILGCSTAGEIAGTEVDEGTLVATALHFEKTRVRAAGVGLEGADRGLAAGEALARQLLDDDLRHVFVLSDGLNVNGSDLVEGLGRVLPREVTLTGGLSGDGDRFGETLVLEGGEAASGRVAAVGLYGSDLRVGCASLGGWDSFGPEREITRSDGNVLYELDGRSALELYREYLGEHAEGLPATGLLFPLALRNRQQEAPALVRTILGVDDEAGSMTFAGDVPTGSIARLMRANFDRLVEGAAGAARECTTLRDSQPDVAVLISCVGRRMVLKQRTEDEVEAVRDVLGAETTLTGFYSYGEISPFTPDARCSLHNQTMTVTTFSEV